MTGVIDPGEAGREYVAVGPQDGAEHIWVMDWMLADPHESPIGEGGLHHHAGDEIFYVASGTVRFHLAGRNLTLAPGGTS